MGRVDVYMCTACRSVTEVAVASTAEVLPQTLSVLGPLQDQSFLIVCCWQAFHKPAGNGGISCRRQNSRRVATWRQCSQHLSLARPQAVPTRCSVHCLMRVLQQLMWTALGLLNSSCSVAAWHILVAALLECSRCQDPCQNLTLPLIPENYSVRPSMESHGGHSDHPVHSRWHSLKHTLFFPPNIWKSSITLNSMQLAAKQSQKKMSVMDFKTNVWLQHSNVLY